MRVAAIYDVHGNLPALEAVLDDVRRLGVDLVVVGGDVVPGPMPSECLALLAALDIPTRFIRGNGEREVLAARAGGVGSTVPERFRSLMEWVGRELDDDTAERLATWPETTRVQVDGLGAVLFCHATPRSDTQIFTRRTGEERIAPLFTGLGAQVVVCGHTHMPFDRMVADVRVVNAGSVGMPFGRTGADWLLLGPEIEARHTTYDLGAAAERVRATRYPQADEFAAANVLDTPDAAHMLAAFTRSELNDGP